LYGDYAKSNYERAHRESDHGSSDFSNVRRTSFLKQETNYSPNQATSVVKKWTPFEMYKDKKITGTYRSGGRTIVKDTDSEAKLQSEQYFVGKKNIGQIDYGVGKSGEFKKVDFNRDQYEKRYLDVDVYANLPGAPSYEQVLTPGAQPTYRTSEQYQYGVRGYSFLDPSSGKTKSERFW